MVKIKNRDQSEYYVKILRQKKKKKLVSPKNYVRKEASTRELTTNREVK